MTEPSLQSSRLALAGGLAAVLAVGAGGFLLGRTTSEREVVAPAPAPAPAIGPAASQPVVSPDPPRRTLGLTDILALANASADATASGRAVPPDVLAAEGRRFDLRLPFGCTGPASEDSDASMRWRYDATKGVLRVHVAPIVWTTVDWWGAAAPVEIETIEGFWIARPWTSSEACPPQAERASGSAPTTLPAQSLALAQFYTKDGARQGRRDGQPYETSTRINPSVFTASQGFQLRLTGRIDSVPGGGPTLCRQPDGAERRPVCVVAVIVDEVAIENPASGETLGTWSLDNPTD